ncbi:hypothetical protein ACFL1G_06085 [Planctomycetota bacterium]
MMVANEKNIVFITPAVLSDGNGGFTLCPQLLIDEELIRFLLNTANVTNYGGKSILT